jgi:hypothetical protein
MQLIYSITDQDASTNYAAEQQKKPPVDMTTGDLFKSASVEL